MIESLSSKPLIFEHPEKLSQGITLDNPEIQAKAYISKEAGKIKFNITVHNKATGKSDQKDIVIAEYDNSDSNNE